MNPHQTCTPLNLNPRVQRRTWTRGRSGSAEIDEREIVPPQSLRLLSLKQIRLRDNDHGHYNYTHVVCNESTPSRVDENRFKITKRSLKVQSSLPHRMAGNIEVKFPFFLALCYFTEVLMDSGGDDDKEVTHAASFVHVRFRGISGKLERDAATHGTVPPGLFNTPTLTYVDHREMNGKSIVSMLTSSSRLILKRTWVMDDDRYSGVIQILIKDLQDACDVSQSHLFHKPKGDVGEVGVINNMMDLLKSEDVSRACNTGPLKIEKEEEIQYAIKKILNKYNVVKNKRQRLQRKTGFYSEAIGQNL
ncbi:hypothetical protein F2P81_003864, partial [Scophthalmus maximus]